MKINSLAVFCGSKNGTDLMFIQHAAELGAILAKNKIALIYGGGGKGIMGALADSMMKFHGRVTGVIPEILLEWEHQHRGITDLIVVEDIHTRKKKIYELCDTAMILPGGYGTLDEFFEMLTWNQLSLHDKPIIILNSNGFYDHLIAHIRQMEKNGFLYDPVEKRVHVINRPEDLLPLIAG